MTNFRSLTAAMLITVCLAGCGERSPVARACMAAVGTKTGTPAAERCRCVEDIAHRQLEPKAYAALEQVALAAEAKGRRSVIGGAVASGEEATRFLANVSATERAITVGDAAFIAVKAAARCR